MFFLRLILLGLLFVLARRVYSAYRSAKSAETARHRARTEASRGAAERPDLGDLTQQDISDADFEEIP